MLRVSEDGTRRREGFAASYRQLRQSLIDLQDAADRIFNTISHRTSEESKKLTDLSRRIQNAKVRIDSISQAKHAVKVMSCSRYPSISASEDFNPLFGYKDGGTGADFPVAKLLVNGGLNREFGVDGTLELYQFFSETTHKFYLKEVQPKGGIEVTNPQRYAFFDNLLGPPDFAYNSFMVAEDHIGANSSHNPKNQPLPPPPPSLIAPNSQSLPESEGFYFRPAAQKLPPPKLPNTFPDLRMVSGLIQSDVGGNQPVEKIEYRVTSTEVLPQLPVPPPPPPLPSSSVTALPSKNHHSGSGSGATTTTSDNIVSSLPIVDSQRAALLASIRDPGIVLRKTEILHHSPSPITSSATPKQDGNSGLHENILSVLKPKSVNLLAEVASSIKLRRRAMQGALYGKEQVESSENNISPSKVRPQFSLPASDLHESVDQSEEDDWDD